MALARSEAILNDGSTHKQNDFALVCGRYEVVVVMQLGKVASPSSLVMQTALVRLGQVGLVTARGAVARCCAHGEGRLEPHLLITAKQ